MTYKNLEGFFNSRQWQAIVIQRLLKEHEQLSQEEKTQQNEAVLTLYRYALDLHKKHPEITVSEAYQLIDIRRKEK